MTNNDPPPYSPPNQKATAVTPHLYVRHEVLDIEDDDFENMSPIHIHILKKVNSNKTTSPKLYCNTGNKILY